MSLPSGARDRAAVGELRRATTDEVQDGMLVVHHTKSGKRRRVPLSEALLEELRVRVGRLVPFEAHYPASFARKVGRMTDLKGFHVHRMRHTVATQWIARRGSLAALQAILGHASVTTTQRYAKLIDAMVRDEARRLKKGA